jgi:hypothetical protein
MATEYFVNQASVPLGVALFACSCGATQVQSDLSHNRPPEGWSTAPDGSARCPHCTNASEKATQDR